MRRNVNGEGHSADGNAVVGDGCLGTTGLVATSAVPTKFTVLRCSAYGAQRPDNAFVCPESSRALPNNRQKASDEVIMLASGM